MADWGRAPEILAALAESTPAHRPAGIVVLGQDWTLTPFEQGAAYADQVLDSPVIVNWPSPIRDMSPEAARAFADGWHERAAERADDALRSARPTWNRGLPREVLALLPLADREWLDRVWNPSHGVS